MIAKKLLWSVFAVVLLLNTGCCHFWENWCERPHRLGHGVPHCQPTPQYCAPVPQHCSPTSQSYSSPPPPLATPGTPTWQRSP